MHDEVDPRVLNANERVTYSRLAAEAARRGRGRPVAVLVVCLTITLGLFVLATASLAQNPESFVDDIAGVLCAVVGCAGAVGVIGMFRDAHVAHAERVRELDRYLQRIRYHDRLRPRPGARRTRDDGGTKTRRQTQSEWYAGHSELTWRDREMGETLGLDADTYVSNYLENDKD